MFPPQGLRSSPWPGKSDLASQGCGTKRKKVYIIIILLKVKCKIIKDEKKFNLKIKKKQLKIPRCLY